MPSKPQKESPRHLLAFETWYSCGRDAATASTMLRQNPAFDVRLNRSTLYRWAEKWGWEARADEMDALIRKQQIEASVKAKVKMLENHAMLGRLLQQAGVAYLQMLQRKRKVLGSGAQAVAAIRQGVDIERAAMGLPTWILDMEKADNAELERTYQELVTAIAASAALDGSQGAAAENNYPTFSVDTVPEDNQAGG